MPVDDEADQFHNRCRSEVAASAERLKYLSQFLEWFGMPVPILFLQYPRTVGLVEPASAWIFPSDLTSISLSILRVLSPDGEFPMCGAQARYTIRAVDDSFIRLYSTIGGAVDVDGGTYGLHGPTRLSTTSSTVCRPPNSKIMMPQTWTQNQIQPWIPLIDRP
jgi:hypothetical protein